MEREALAEAVETDVEGVRTRMMTAEPMVAMALETEGARDYARIVQFLELVEQTATLETRSGPACLAGFVMTKD